MSITSLRGSTLPNKSFRAGRAKTRDVVRIAPDTATTFANGAPISTGGGGGSGVTISNVSVTDSGYILSNTTPYIDSTGGYIKITGTGFASGCTVYVSGTPATSTTFISSTEVRAQVGAAASNAQSVYVVNTDSSVAILLNAITYSGTPSWSTSATLSSQVSDIAFSIPLSATSDSSIVYTLASGSSTPSGTTLFSNGVFAGTVTGITSDTNYSFTVVATDVENQLSSRAFTVSVSSGDQYFNTAPLLLNGEATTWITDSSTNKFVPTIVADTKPTAFSPYNTNWSLYFSGVNNYLTVAANAGYNPGNTGAWTFECFIYPLNSTGGSFYGHGNGGAYGNSLAMGYGSGQFSFSQCNGDSCPVSIVSAANYLPNQWYHYSVCKDASNVIRLFVNGVQVGTQTYSSAVAGGGQPFINGLYDNVGFGRGGGAFYLSDVHWVVGTALYTSTPFPIPTERISAVANTKILIGQTRRFLDTGSLAGSWTIGGTVTVSTFGRFTETDTTAGSGYFDGTGDYLSYTANSAFAFGTGDFTLEAWIFLPSYPSAGTIAGQIISAHNWSGGTIDFGFRVNAAGTLYFEATGGANVTSTIVVPLGQWNHVVCVRSSGTMTFYINGLRRGSASITTSIPSTTAISLGHSVNGGTYGALTGYISDARIVKGVAVYTGNFTPQTSSLSSTQSSGSNIAAITSTATSLLTLQYRRGENNHRFVDEAGIKYPLTRGGQVSQGSFSPFSPAGWSVFFNGTSDFLSIPANAAFNNLSGTTFTFEFWMYPTAFASGALYNEGRTIFSTAGTFPNGWRVELTTTSVTWYDYVGSTRISYAVSLNTWTHVAFTYSSNNLIMYVNGVNRGSASSVTWNNSSGSALIGALNSGSYIYYYQGYISNLRLVAGLVYTGNFTPQTSSLTVTQSSGSNIAAITTGQTVFLTAQSNRFIDANTIPKTVTIGSGTPRIQAFSPFRPGVSYSPTLHGGSAYFDGTGDYITTVSTTSKILPAASTNTFTIDGWLYPTTLGVLSWIFGDMEATGGTNDVSVDLSSSNFVELYWYDGASKRATSTTAVVLNQWNYFAIVVNNNAITIYVNSTTAGQGGTTTLTNRTLGTSGWSMGGWNSSSYYTGYMSSIRWSNGVARTISSIPTAPPSLDANTSVLMNFTQGGVVDASARNVIETVADVKIANVQSKFGTGALSFDGTGDYLLVSPNPDLEFGSGDFTIEFWWYPTSTVRQGLYHGSFGTDWSVGIDYNGVSTNKIGIWASTNGSSWNLINGDPAGNGIGTTTISQNQWTHIAYVRSGTSWMLFVNGSRDLNLTGLSGTIVNRATSRKAIGAWWSTGSLSQASGYFDDFRISKYARYTANFTPPTSALLTK